jgi:RND superfamily putative drug exporter
MLAWLSVRLRLLVVAAWVAGAAAATILLPSLADASGAPLGGLVPTGADAIHAAGRSAELFPLPLRAPIAIVERDADGLSQDALRTIAERAADIDTAGGRHPSGAIFALPLVNDPAIVPEAREASTTAITWVAFSSDVPPSDQVERARTLAADSPVVASGGFAGVTGSMPARLAEFDVFDDGLTLVEIATVALIAALLAITFGSLGAPLVALLSAAVAYLVAVRAVAWIGEEIGLAIPQEVEPLMVVILLVIVTDYSIFFLAGTRRRLEAGERRVDAAQHAAADVLPTVLTAGLIVAAGTAALLAGKLEFFRALGPGMALSALVGLAVSVTLVPALLAILGRLAYWPRLRRHALADESSRVEQESRQSLRARIARGATAKPAAAVIVLVALATLAVAASGLRSTNLGFTLVRGLPQGSEPRAADLQAARGFADGIVAPTEILVEDGGVATRRDALVSLERLIARQPGVAGVLGPREVPDRIAEGVVISAAGDAARYAVVLEDPPLGGPAIDHLEALRDAMPSLTAKAGITGVRTSFAGDTALASETVASTLGDVARIALAALAVNALLLVVFLRSLVAPLLLLAASVFALGAALGITTFVFQGLLGHDELTYYVPFAAAVLLVSLGSDYNVFVSGQIAREAARRPLRDAVAIAAPRAGRTITIAGVALAASFAALGFIPTRAFHELAFALAIGVVVDAFLVRSLLVPALISLFGQLTWWPRRRRTIVRGALEPTAEARRAPPA